MTRYMTPTETAQWQQLVDAAPDDAEEACDWCGEPITSDEPGEPCSGRDGPIHPHCHYESGCRRVE